MAVSILCVILALVSNRARSQARAAKAVTAMGGIVVYDFQLAEKYANRDSRELTSKPARAFIAEVVGIDFVANVTGLDLDSNKVTDESLEVILKFPSLKLLDLKSDALTDRALAVIAKCKNLETLSLRGHRITDAGLEILQRELPDCYMFLDPTSSPFEGVLRSSYH